ncbi:DUF6268 family outer membrane beta-barrel protein [Flavobacterium sp. GT3R68]|uniref:DUF6268 family outer membrane beta-barrel protein n=1 Tax=Flavobacterium sp. GT3R68 TaxID=2594437 RepID=UPI000F878AD4|nr:DUF6268 family outer membrane beta-barrel protein [Flavobacterium sp. GT3R68]RTY90955.1 hypothetical protein EKL32_20060 [Flavobacterium sp. GSN2]TRW90518.1 hypothetical protein FNW07_10840 [Flavobacterium sp. GT3R68]
MKIIIQLLFLLLPFLCSSQEYIDVFSINYGKSQETTFENSSVNTSISTFQTNLILPIVLNKKYTAITWVNFSSYNLQLFPDSNNNHLYSTNLRVGLRINHSKHWSGIYLFMPKVASDYIHLSSEDIYLGGTALLKYKRNKNFGYSIGLYGSSEAYGISMTPIIGLYYHSPNERFEMNFLLPNDADVNYRLTDKTKIGVDFLGHGNSYKLTTDNIRSKYVENNSIDFSAYIQKGLFGKKVLLRLKMGYTLNEFRIYPIDQKLDLQILALKFGDNRTLFLEDKSNTILLKVEAIYRFDLSTDKK